MGRKWTKERFDRFVGSLLEIKGNTTKTIQDKALLLMCLFIGVICVVIGIPTNVIINANPIVFLAPVIAAIIFLGIYFVIRNAKTSLAKYYFLVVIGAYVVLGVTYFHNAGAKGSIPLFWIFFILFLSVIKGKLRIVLLVLSILSISMLLFFEWRNPDLVKPYDSRMAFLIDMFTSILANIIFMYLLATYTIDQFEKEQHKVIVQNRMIEEQKNQIVELSNLERDLNNMKLDFYTHVSHEIRTPLSLITAPTEKLLVLEKDEFKRKYLEHIQKNAENIQNLVDQIMDLRKIDVKELRLFPSMNDIISFTENILRSFGDLAESSGVKLNFRSAWPEFIMNFDKVKLERAFSNLITNAIKFTPKNGSVEVDVSKQDEMLTIEIKDTGQGIPEKYLGEIFNPFYQVPDTKYGTGIGLTIVREYIHLHGGKIAVESQMGNGTIFTISLPVEIGDTSQMNVQSGLNEDQLDYMTIPDQDESQSTDTRYKLLLIDDNKEIVNYLEEELSGKYEIIKAYDGEVGLTMAHEHQPDLIIADVMMPLVDGIEFCKQIKNQADTSHIPVILLTAKAAEEHQVEGYRTGADDYVIKPFSMKVLLARIENIIAQREKLHKIFASSTQEINPQDVGNTKPDQEFLEKAYKLIRKNLNDPNFGVSEMVDQMNVSRSLMHVKLKKLVNLSTSEFIMIVRLRSAAKMIRNSSQTISQISYDVGFSDPTYFTKMFKKYFNQTPKEYRS